jgi:hypothetical protein
LYFVSGEVMNIDTINGPGGPDRLQPAATRNEMEPVDRVPAPMLNDTIRIDWDVMDRITISPNARRRYEEWRERIRKRKRETR